MTTAAERIAELGLDMVVVQQFIMAQVQAGNAAGLLQACQTYGVTAGMLAEIATHPGTPLPEALVHEWFAAHGLDSSSIATPVGQAVVESVSSPVVTEGMSIGFVVTLAAETQGDCPLDISIGGTAGLGDMASYMFSHGVTLSGLTLNIPAGVSSFTVTLVTANDTEIEGTETFSLTAGGVTGTATINDDDQAPPSGIALMPEELEGMLDIIQLNGAMGDLSTTHLRGEIIAGSGNESAYWSLFQVTGYAGADDGIFTNAETGWSIGDQEASSATMESVFFGTMINALASVDNAEMAAIGAFMFAHQGGLQDDDYPELIALLVDAFEDPVASGAERAFTDEMIHEAIVEVGIELVAMAQQEPSVFHGLLNWL